MKTTYSQPSNLNQYWIGLLIGIGFPVIFILFYFLILYGELTFAHFIQIMWKAGKLIHVLSLATVINLIPFMFFIRTSRFKAAKGILAFTILCVASMFVLKFFFI